MRDISKRPVQHIKTLVVQTNRVQIVHKGDEPKSLRNVTVAVCVNTVLCL